MDRNIFVIYHHNCPDGFGAAYAAWLKFADRATYIPARYGDPSPEMPLNSTVYILDFSYPRDTVVGLSKHHELTLLDHHKTAQQSLTGLPGCVFDLSASGAALAWQHFHPGRPMPLLLAYVQDRDLWQLGPLQQQGNKRVHSIPRLRFPKLARHAHPHGVPPSKSR